MTLRSTVQAYWYERHGIIVVDCVSTIQAVRPPLTASQRTCSSEGELLQISVSESVEIGTFWRSLQSVVYY